MSGPTVLTVLVGVCAPERHQVARLLARWHPVARVPEDESDLRIAVAVESVRAAAPRLVIELPTATCAHEVLALSTAHTDPGTSDLHLGSIIAVVDAGHLLEDLQDDGDIPAAWCSTPVARTRSVLAVDHIEHADAVLIVGWRGCSRTRLDTTLPLIAHLNPRARLSLLHDEPTWGSGLVASHRLDHRSTPGWVHLLNDEHDPFITGHGITGLHYTQLRPFHPERLRRLMDAGLEHRYGQLLRSAGFCTFATRPGTTARWEQVGPVITFETLRFHPSTTAEVLTLGQDLALIGHRLDPEALTAALDACTLTDVELEEGPTRWLTYHDPFPGWRGSPAR